MIDELLENLESTYDQEREKFYGVTVGRVINPLDPMSLGRVQVQLPFIDSLDLSPWARVAVPMAGLLYGTYFIPNLGDEVLVAFEHGDVNAPYILGCLWNAVARPPLPTPLTQVRAIRTLSGNQIVIEEVPPAITIQTAPTPPVTMPLPASPVGPHQTIRMSPTGIEIMSPLKITLQVGLNSLTIDPTGITLMAGANMLTVTPDSISLLATDIDLTAFLEAAITATMVRINS
jgi:Type VI secretion system/phage-baseplate injector OB domain